MRLAALLLLFTLLSACARNAVLEVELTVPAQPATGPARFAVVQFETDQVAFESDWRSSNDYPGAPLAPEPQTLAYSIVSEDPQTVVQVKVSFCTTESCTALPEDAPDRTPAVWYRLERSLFVGQRTRWRPVIDAVPSDPPEAVIEVDKCEIEGCITATGETSFCRLSGEHYCE